MGMEPGAEAGAAPEAGTGSMPDLGALSLPEAANLSTNAMIAVQQKIEQEMAGNPAQGEAIELVNNILAAQGDLLMMIEGGGEQTAQVPPSPSTPESGQ